MPTFVGRLRPLDGWTAWHCASTAGSLPALMPLHPSTDPEAAAAGEQGAFRLGATVVCLCLCVSSSAAAPLASPYRSVCPIYSEPAFFEIISTASLILCASVRSVSTLLMLQCPGSLSLSANARLSVYVSLQLAPTFPTFRSLYLFSFFLSFFYTRYCRTN